MKLDPFMDELDRRIVATKGTSVLVEDVDLDECGYITRIVLRLANGERLGVCGLSLNNGEDVMIGFEP